MSLSLKQLRDLMADEIGDDDPQETANYTKYLNLAASEAFYFATWESRKDFDFVETKAPYATGTVTLTNGSDDVVGVSSVWTTAAHGAPSKIALGYSRPPYEIRTVTDNTNIILEENYAGSTVATQAYVLYRDAYRLDPRVKTLSRVRIFDTDRTWDVPVVTGNRTGDTGEYPMSAGRPLWAVLERVTDGEPVIRLGPYAPDAAYRLKYEYFRRYESMKEDGDTHGLGDDFDGLILDGALARAYRRDHFTRARSLRADFLSELRRKRGEPGLVSPAIFQIAERGPVERSIGDWPFNVGDLEI